LQLGLIGALNSTPLARIGASRRREEGKLLL